LKKIVVNSGGFAGARRPKFLCQQNNAKIKASWFGRATPSKQIKNRAVLRQKIPVEEPDDLLPSKQIKNRAVLLAPDARSSCASKIMPK